MKKQMTRILSATLFSLFVLFLGACDQNMAHPDDIRQFSFSVTDFSADPVEIIYGESATLTWDIKDPDGLIQYLEVIPEVGPQGKNLARTVKVFPKTTTTYFLNIYKDNVLTNKRGVVSVKVKTAEGKEIVDESDIPPEIPTTETSCADGIDEDQDGTADCADSDCVEDVACIVPDKFTDCTTYPTASAQNVIENGTVTVSWEGCPFYKVIHDGIPYEATGSLPPVTATELGTLNIVLDGRSEEGLITDTVVIPVTVGPYDSPPLQVEEMSFHVHDGVTGEEATTLIAGQDYSIHWEVVGTGITVKLVSDTGRVDEDNQPIIEEDDNIDASGTRDLIAGDYVTHTLVVTDSYGNVDQIEIPLTILDFVKDNSVSFSKNLKKMIQGDDAGEFYFVIASRDENGADDSRAEVVYYTNDYLNTVSTIETTVFTEIESLAVKGADIYIGNLDGVFKKQGEEYKQMAFTGRLDTFTTLLARENGDVLGGTGTYVYNMRNGNCEPVGEGQTEADVDCYFFLYDANDKDMIENGSFPIVAGTAHFYEFLQVPGNANRIYALTSEGIYRSVNNGASFNIVEDLFAELTAGYLTSSGGFLWSTNDVYEYNGEGLERVMALSGVTGINYVVSQNGFTIAATDTGVILLRDGSEINIYSKLEKPTLFLIVSGNKVVAITRDLEKYVLDLEAYGSSEEAESQGKGDH